MKRKSINQLDEQGQSIQYNHNTNVYFGPSNVNAFNSFQYCSALQLQDSCKECRICLQQIQDVNHNFISPCKCTGSLKFVHQSCFLMWLERLYSSKSVSQQKILKSSGLPCQICKQRIFLIFNNVSTCLTHEEIKSKIQNNFTIFVILLIFTIVIIGSLGFIIFFMQNSTDSFGSNIGLTVLVVCALAFLLTAICLALYYLITRYCVEMKSKLESFKIYRQNRKIKSRRKIIPAPMS